MITNYLKLHNNKIINNRGSPKMVTQILVIVRALIIIYFKKLFINNSNSRSIQKLMKLVKYWNQYLSKILLKKRIKIKIINNQDQTKK